MSLEEGVVISRCSHSNGSDTHVCLDTFNEWIHAHFDVETTPLWERRGLRYKHVWPERAPFEPGDWVVHGIDFGVSGQNSTAPIWKIYQVLKRAGPRRYPRYDLRVVAACCPNNDYSASEFCIAYVDRIGRVEYGQEGRYYLKLTPKTEIMGWMFHCDETHRPQAEWEAYHVERRGRKRKGEE